MKSDLLIIGNGFDLASKLNTSFSQYLSKKSLRSSLMDLKILNDMNLENKNNHVRNVIFMSIEDNIEKQLYNKSLNINQVNPNLISALKDSNKSLFDIYFELVMVDNPNWSDVEGKLSSLIHNEFFNKVFEDISKFKDILEETKKIEDPFFGSDETKKNAWDQWHLGTEKFYNESDSERLFIYFLINIFDYQILQHSSNYFTEFLFDQLKKFEINLGNYIEKESQNESYQSNANDIFSEFQIKNKVNILNFNYTNPFDSMESNEISKISNIHGTTDDPIIGVDSENVKTNNNLNFNQFTKTYRIMNNSEDRVDILPDNVENIYFYGHSLAPADYSYFQSIFDFYDLYGSNLNLVFYYSVYDESIKNEIINNNINNIWNLINKYGESMGNSQGKNLLHKLNLENRIKIIEIQ